MPNAANTLHSLSVSAALRRLAQSFGDAPAIADEHRSLSFRELDARADNIARALGASGVKPGERIAMLLPNGVSQLELFFAAARARAILLPVNWRLAPPEIAYIIADAEPAIAFASAQFGERADALRALPRCIELGEDGAPFATVDASDYAVPAAEDEAEAHDPWLMLYTSGTTGRPKGCLLNQGGNWLAAQAQALAWRVTHADRLGSSLPLFHVGGLHLVLAHLFAGASVRIAPHTFGAADALGWLAVHRCTTTAIPVQYYETMLAHKSEGHATPTLRCINLGGGMHQPEFVRAATEGLNATAVCGYGQTEASGFLTALTHEEQLARPASCGRALAHIEWRIVDAADQPLPTGEAGELCVRAPSVMEGYWRNEAASAQTLRGGWLHTGDIACADADGFLTLIGRSKELIKSGGENVYPSEVESALRAHPAVADCTVFGVAHAYWGEAVKAAVVLAPDATTTPRELADWCRTRIAAYKRPRFVEFMAEIPRSDLGKVQKLALQKLPCAPEQSTD